MKDEARDGGRPEDRALTRQPWQTPAIEELAVQESAFNPSVGSDGGVADCSHA